MGGLLGDLWVRFRGDNRHLLSTIKQSNTAIGQFNQQVTGSRSVLGRMSAASERAFSSVVNWTKRAVFGVGAVVGAIGTLAVKGGIERLLGLENADRRLRSLGMSAGDTRQLMGFLNDTLLGTAFSLDQGAQAITGFVASGLSLEEVERRFSLLADSAAFAQVPLADIGVVFEQIQNKGQAYTAELQMLAQRGVPVFQILAAGAKKSIPEVQAQLAAGAISAQEFFDLYAKGAEGFGENNVKLIGSAKNMGETTSGAWANMRTAMSRTAASLLEGIFPSIRDGLLALTDWFNEFGERVKPAFDDLWATVQTNAGDMGQALRDIGDVVIDVVVRDVIPAIEAVIPFFVDLAQLAGDLAQGFGMLPDPVRRLLLALVGLGTPLLAVIGGVIKLSRVLGPLTSGFGAFLSLLVRARSISDVAALLTMTLNPAILAVVAALGLAFVAWRKYNDEQKFVAETTANVVEALRLDSGALGDNTREVVKNQLARKDLISQADGFGLSIADVIDAALGEEAALKRVRAALESNDEIYMSVNGSVVQLTREELNFLDAIGQVAGGVAAATDSYKEFNFEQVEMVRVGDEVLPTLSKARAENEHLAAASRAAAAAEREQAGDTADLAANLELLTDAQKGALQAIQGWADPMSTYTDLLAQKNEAEKASAEATADATKKSTDSWEDYFTETQDSFETYMRALNQRLEDERAWHRNLNKIRQAAGDEYADMLQARGPEYAGLVAEIAKQERDKIRQAGKLELELRDDVAREGIRLLLRTGALRITQAGGLAEDEVKAIAEQLGVAPDVVKRIYNDMRGNLIDRFNAMVKNADKLSEDQVKAIAKQLGVTPDIVWDLFGAAKENQRKRLNKMIRNAGLGGTTIANQLGTMLDKGQVEVFKIMKAYARKLRDGLNPVIKAVNGKPIVFSSAARAQRVFQALSPGRNPGIQRNLGGPVPGGGPNRDTVHAALTPGEHIWTREEVRRAGGHQAMERLRRKSMVGQLHGFQAGGRVPVPSDTEGQRTPHRDRAIADRLVTERRLASMGLPGFQTGGRVTGDLVGLKSGFLARLRAYSAGIKTALRVVSGYRSYAQQAYLYATKPGLAAPPGRSLHQQGIAADLSPQLGGTSRGNPAAHRFGLTYPMSYEPWHIQLMRGIAAGSTVGLLPPLKIPKMPSFPSGHVGRAAKDALEYTIKQVREWYAEQEAAFGFGGVGGAAGGGGSVRQIVQRVAGTFGWGSGSQWAALTNLISRESGWRPSAQNPTSTAYGLFQFLNSTWGGTGIGKTSDPERQTIAGLRYIRSRYGTPAGAWGFWQRNNWYDEGGLLRPGTTVATNTTGKSEVIAAEGMIRKEVSQGLAESFGDLRITLEVPELGGRLDGRIKQVRREDHLRERVLARKGVT